MKRRNKASLLNFSHPSQTLGVGLLVLCLCLATILLIMEKTNPKIMQSAQNAAADIAAPIAGLFAAPRDAVITISERMDNYTNTYAQNEQLKKENKALLKWQALAHQYAKENEQMRKLLQVVPDGGQSFISARMVSSFGSASKHVALISAGLEDGVKKNVAVVAAEGLVGRVIEVGKKNARILLITDTNANIPVVNERSGEKAILTGHPNGVQLKLDLADKPDLFNVGDRLVTSGDGGIIPSNIPVASIVAINGVHISATPLADIHQSSIVTIVDYSF